MNSSIEHGVDDMKTGSWSKGATREETKEALKPTNDRLIFAYSIILLILAQIYAA
ncbi:hypothetical protein C2S51_027736 [Perilla frutescens var. frutescens]|nr:hypothetical protein C2S51_027736 [Perilla frutescens var. frutescens]